MNLSLVTTSLLFQCPLSPPFGWYLHPVTQEGQQRVLIGKGEPLARLNVLRLAVPVRFVCASLPPEPDDKRVQS